MSGPDQATRLESAIRENEGVLINWLTRRLGSRDAANDVAQSVFLRLWRYAATSAIENPRALLFKTAGNLAVNELKRRNRFERHHCSTAKDGDGVEDIACEQATPEKEASVKQDLQAVLNAIEALPEPVRSAFKMNRFEGLSYRDIAARLGVSESSVEKYMIRALRSLRGALEDQDE